MFRNSKGAKGAMRLDEGGRADKLALPHCFVLLIRDSHSRDGQMIKTERKSRSARRGALQHGLWRVLSALVPAMLPVVARAAHEGGGGAAASIHRRPDESFSIAPVATPLAVRGQLPATLKVAPAGEFGFFGRKPLAAPTVRRAGFVPLSSAIAPGAGGVAQASNASATDIVLDNSLGTSTTSRLLPDGSGIVTIPAMGAKQVGGNLFYSFSEFDVGAGQIADFAPGAISVQNVLARVTGGPSEINGTLRCRRSGRQCLSREPRRNRVRA